jgi:exonuclease III
VRIETINIWGGRLYEPLNDFISDQSVNVDIFCLQEVFDTTSERKITGETHPVANLLDIHPDELPDRANGFTEFSRILPDHKGFFRPTLFRRDHSGEVDFDLRYGLAAFVRKSLIVLDEGEISVYDRDESVNIDNRNHSRNMQYLVIEMNGTEVTIGNLHGLWTGGGKGDTDARLEQSRRVKTFLDSRKSPKILCGDFNLLPDTESLRILEDGMVNLVKEYGITSTRSEYYTKPEKFADYIFVSPDVEVKDFRVLPDPVSDHLPLLLEFS